MAKISVFIEFRNLGNFIVGQPTQLPLIHRRKKINPKQSRDVTFCGVFSSTQNSTSVNYKPSGAVRVIRGILRKQNVGWIVIETPTGDEAALGQDTPRRRARNIPFSEVQHFKKKIISKYKL